MSPPVHRRLGRALAGLLVLGPALAGALGDALAADRLALKWTAPAGCPAAAEVKAEVDRLLGASRVQPAKTIDVSGAVSRDERGTWHVRLETPAGGTTRAREIHGASCRAVTDAAALVLALMIDPEAVAAAPSASGSASVAPSSTGTNAAAPPSATGTDAAAPSTTGTDAAAPPSATGTLTRTPGGSGATAAPSGSAPPAQGAAPTQGAAPAPSGLPLSPGPLPLPMSSSTPSFTVPVPRAPEPPPRLPLSFRVGVWGGADAGSLPGVSGGLGGAVALVVGRQRIEIGVAVRPGTEAHLAGRPTAGGSVDLVTGSLGTCRTLLAGRFEMAPCLSLEAGRMHAKGFGVSSPDEAEQPWIAASGGGLFTWWPASRFGVVARVDATVPLARPTFVLEGVGPVHTPSPVAGRLSAGVELRF